MLNPAGRLRCHGPLSLGTVRRAGGTGALGCGEPRAEPIWMSSLSITGLNFCRAGSDPERRPSRPIPSHCPERSAQFAGDEPEQG